MGRRLFVGNLNYQTTGDDLKELFGQHGTCSSASVMFDRATGRSRGFGFVEMSSDEEAAKAVQELNGKDFQGRSLNVNEARERTPGGGGSGFRDRGPERSFTPSWQDPPADGDPGASPFDGGFSGGWGRGPKKPFKEGGSRRGLRARKRSL